MRSTFFSDTTVKQAETTSFTQFNEFQKICINNKIQIPIILDTDIFHDPDDFKIFILNLIKQSHISIKGIVTTGEFPEIKARVIKSVLLAMNISDIPVFAGKGLSINQVKLSNGKNATTVEEALTLPRSQQIQIIQDEYPTQCAKYWEGFYRFQGRAYLSFKFNEVKYDGNLDDAIHLMKKIVSHQDLAKMPSNLPKLIVISIGELTNIAEYYRNNLASQLFVYHMGGWYGQPKNSIFPLERPGKNTVCDIKATEFVINHSDANIILYMSHLKKQYGLELTGYVRKLLCLVDEPLKKDDLTETRWRRLLTNLICDLNLIDLKDCLFNQEMHEKICKLNSLCDKREELAVQISKIPLDEVYTLVYGLLPSMGVTSLPYADKPGCAIARDFSNWGYYTGYNKQNGITCSDPAAFITAIHPKEFIKETTQITMTVNASLAIEHKEIFNFSNFEKSIQVKPGGRISAITELHNSQKILDIIVTGLISHCYPGVTLKEFMAITNDDKSSLKEKSSLLNKLVSTKQLVIENTQRIRSPSVF